MNNIHNNKSVETKTEQATEVANFETNKSSLPPIKKVCYFIC